jgi:hypothetical protein
MTSATRAAVDRGVVLEGADRTAAADPTVTLASEPEQRTSVTQRPHGLFVGPIDRIYQRLLARTPVAQIHLRPSDADQRAPTDGAQPSGKLIAQALAQSTLERPANRPPARANWERQVGPIAKPPSSTTPSRARRTCTAIRVCWRSATPSKPAARRSKAAR